MTGFPLRRAILAGVLASAAVVPMIAPMPAYAQFGGIVYDPTNYAQNVLQAARALEQINNQITSLQNEAQMLINQARNLTSLPYSALQDLQQSVQRTINLNRRAQPIIAQLIQNGIGAERLIRCIQDAIDQCLILCQRTGR